MAEHSKNERHSKTERYRPSEFQTRSDFEPPLYGSQVKVYSYFSDSLVLHLQLFHDGHLPGWPGLNDLDANFEERLCKIFKGGRY